MSAIRVYIDGRPDWLPIDDGATPLRHNRGMRGAAFDNPVLGAHAVGESSKTIADRGKREYNKREYNARKYRPGVSQVVDDSGGKNPDNGGVQATTTEVQT
jgi:hypothetical protein